MPKIHASPYTYDSEAFFTYFYQSYLYLSWRYWKSSYMSGAVH